MTRTIKVEHNDEAEDDHEWKVSIKHHDWTAVFELNDSEFDELVRQAATLHISYHRFSTLFRVA